MIVFWCIYKINIGLNDCEKNIYNTLKYNYKVRIYENENNFETPLHIYIYIYI